MDAETGKTDAASAADGADAVSAAETTLPMPRITDLAGPPPHDGASAQG